MRPPLMVVVTDPPCGGEGGGESGGEGGALPDTEALTHCCLSALT